ncbi:hypothetical protein BT69DRAFT_162043 [Atractiella rhizophila]|nr:hypothetical protein BT69DRAFT_162043 [Atractiella rhizophila]
MFETCHKVRCGAPTFTSTYGCPAHLQGRCLHQSSGKAAHVSFFRGGIVRIADKPSSSSIGYREERIGALVGPLDIRYSIRFIGCPSQESPTKEILIWVFRRHP